MFNHCGEVIGIVSYILARTRAFEGVGFAAAFRSVRELLLSRPFLGAASAWRELSDGFEPLSPRTG